MIVMKTAGDHEWRQSSHGQLSVKRTHYSIILSASSIITARSATHANHSTEW